MSGRTRRVYGGIEPKRFIERNHYAHVIGEIG